MRQRRISEVLGAASILAILCTAPSLALAQPDVDGGEYPSIAAEHIERPDVWSPSGIAPQLLDRDSPQVRVSVLLRSQPVLEAASVPEFDAQLYEEQAFGNQVAQRVEIRRTAAIATLAPAARKAARSQQPVSLLIERLGGEIERSSALPNSLTTTISRAALDELASLPAVQAVLPARRPHPLMDTAIPATGASAWWAAGHTGGDGANDIAVVDVGMYQDLPDVSHPALSGVELDKQPGWSGGSEDHGTVTGAEIASQDQTYPGAAPGIDEFISGEIDYAVGLPVGGGDRSADPAEIINYSAGGGNSEEEADLLASTFAVTFVPGAGNSGPGSGTVGEPASGRNVITAGGVDPHGTVTTADDTMLDLSSRGPTSDNRKKPDLVAPAKLSQAPNGSWEELGTPPSWDADLTQPDWVEPTGPGTSWAAPLVSSGAALLWGTGITDPNAQKAILINSARDGRAPDQPMGTQAGWQPDWGWGLLDLEKAFADRSNYVSSSIAGGSARFYRATVAAADKATLTWRLRGVFSRDAAQRIKYTVTNLDLHQYRASDGAEIQPTAPPGFVGGPNALDPNDTVEQVRSPSAQPVIYKVKAESEVAGRPTEPFALAAEAPLQELMSPTLDPVEATASTASPSCGEQVQISVRLQNASPDLAASNATVHLDLPEGIELVAGSATQSVEGGELAAGTTSAFHTWTVEPTTAGTKTLAITGRAQTFGEGYLASAETTFTASCDGDGSGGGSDPGGGTSPGGGSGGGSEPKGEPAASSPTVRVSNLSLSAELPVQCGVPVGLVARLLNDSSSDAQAARVELLSGDDVVIESGGASQVVSDGTLAAGEHSELHGWTVRQLAPGRRELTITGYAAAPGGTYYHYPYTVAIECERYASKLASEVVRAKRGGIVAIGRVEPAKHGIDPGGEVEVVAKRLGRRGRAKITSEVRKDGSFRARLSACKPGRWQLRARYMGDAGYRPSKTSWPEKVRVSRRQAQACAERN